MKELRYSPDGLKSRLACRAKACFPFTGFIIHLEYSLKLFTGRYHSLQHGFSVCLLLFVKLVSTETLIRVLPRKRRKHSTMLMGCTETASCEVLQLHVLIVSLPGESRSTSPNGVIRTYSWNILCLDVLINLLCDKIDASVGYIALVDIHRHRISGGYFHNSMPKFLKQYHHTKHWIKLVKLKSK